MRVSLMLLTGVLGVVAVSAFAAELPPLINAGAPPPGYTAPRVPMGQVHSALGFVPRHAFKCGESGDVKVELTLGTDGVVSDAHLAHSSGFADLDVDAVVAVRTWRYEPALLDGKPVAVRLYAIVGYRNPRRENRDEDCSPDGTQAAADALEAALRAQ